MNLFRQEFRKFLCSMRYIPYIQTEVCKNTTPLYVGDQLTGENEWVVTCETWALEILTVLRSHIGLTS